MKSQHCCNVSLLRMLQHVASAVLNTAFLASVLSVVLYRCIEINRFRKQNSDFINCILCSLEMT